jgi:hypothetical protein
MTTESILEILRDPGHELPEEALAEVIRRRDEFVPLLITALEETARLAADQPEAINGINCLPAFAVLLLAQFRAATAIEAVLTAFNMTDEPRAALFGEAFSVDGARILATICDKNPEPLRQCAKRKSFDPFARWAVFQALTILAAWGHFPVAELVQFFGELFDSNAYADDVEVWTDLVSVCVDFGARPFLDRIRALYDRQMIDTEIVGDFEDIEASVPEDAEALRGVYGEAHPPVDDAAEEVSWWPQFNPDDESDDAFPKTVELLLESLRHPDEAPEEELEEIGWRRDEFVPLLIAAVEDAVGLAAESPDEIDEEDCLPAIAIIQLAQFREVSAIEAVLKAFELPEESRYAIFGDVLAMEGSRVLATLCSNEPEALERCAKREAFDQTVRWAVFEALALQASWGIRRPEAVVKFFSGLFDSNAFGEDVDSWTYLVSVCVEFGCQPFLDQIRALYDRGLVDTSIVGELEEVEAAASDDPAKLRREYAESMPPIDNTAEEISAWERFNLEEEWADDDLLEADSYVPPKPMPPAVPIRVEPKIGRNDPCPCGSGKKYKKCCMKV